MSLMKEISFEEFKKMVHSYYKKSDGIELTEDEKKACDWFKFPTEKYPIGGLRSGYPVYFGYYEFNGVNSEEINSALHKHIKKAIDERGYENVIVEESVTIDGIDIKLNYRVENVD